MTEAQLRERYDGCKPCLHGSDAHDHDAVAAPAGDRFSWVKGDLHFDTLRQACIDPAGRAFVGASPPSAAIPSQIISHIEIGGATWAKTPRIPLNPGLVAVIGARGSGKTALMDMIAAGCDALPRRSARAADGPSASFIERAAELLGDAQVELAWQTGGFERAGSMGRTMMVGVHLGRVTCRSSLSRSSVRLAVSPMRCCVKSNG